MSESKTIKYKRIPWNGGVNSSVDSGVLPDNDLVQADNVVFNTAGSRLKREAIDQFDLAAQPSSITKRSATGTTRTLVFSSALLQLVPTNQQLVVGENITVSGGDATETAHYAVTATPVTAIKFVFTVTSATASAGATYTNNSVTFTVDSTISGATTLVCTTASNTVLPSGTVLTKATGSGDATITFSAYTQAITYTVTSGSYSESLTTASSTLSLVKSSYYIETADFWYTSNSGLKTQAIMALSSQGKLFSHDSSGKRAEILSNGVLFTMPQASPATASAAAVYKDADQHSFTVSSAATLSPELFTSSTIGAPTGSMYTVRIAPTYSFTVTAANATVNARYTDNINNYSFIVTSTITGATTLVCYGVEGVTGAPGTLTKQSGTGDATITYSAVGAAVPGTVNATVGAVYTNNAHQFTVLQTVSASTTIQFNGTGAPYTNPIGAAFTKNSGTGDSAFVFVVNGTTTATSTYLTKSSGSGDSVIQFSAAAAVTVPTTATRAQMIVMNERALFFLNGIGNLPIQYVPNSDSTNFFMLGGSPPDAEFAQLHLNRLFCNDKNNKDRLQYCATGNPESWNGLSDSGALDINPGDGDSIGLSAIFPPLQAQLVVSKGKHLSAIVGDSPDNFQVVPITEGMGATGSKAVAAVDFQDIFFISQRGIHSIKSTTAAGDFQSAFLSQTIQPTYNTWPKNLLTKASCCYWPEMNALFFSVAEANTASPNAFWIYNIVTKGWHRWPSSAGYFTATSMNLIKDSSTTNRLCWGVAGSKIYRANAGIYTDLGTTNAIPYTIQTGTIYPDNDPQRIKGFKKLSLLFRPKGRFSFILSYQIDNLAAQSTSFSQDVTGAQLGVNFILGGSVLGSSLTFAPYTVPLEGFGRGIRFTITNSNKDEQVELYGYIIEYEPSDVNQETL